MKEIDKQKHITTTAPYKTAKGCLCGIRAQYNSKGQSVWYPCAAHKLKQKKQEDIQTEIKNSKRKMVFISSGGGMRRIFFFILCHYEAAYPL